MKLTELFDLYARKRLRVASPNTHRLYRHSIAAFEVTLKREATTLDLIDDNLDEHMARLIRDGLAVATANKDYAQITAIWRFANRNRLVDTWPNVQPYPEPERVPLGWLPDELDRLFEAIAKEEGSIAGSPACLWWKTLILVLLDCGERIGAIRKLKRENIQGNCLLVPASYRKGKTRDKLFQLSPYTMECLKILLMSHRQPELFPWDRCPTYIYNRYKKILSRAGLSVDSRSKFHRIRRTVASAVKNQGGDATSAMDHANAKTTKKYLDPRIVGGKSTSQFVSDWRNHVTH
jgi:integrase